MTDEIRVFIGSAAEDLPVVDVITESLTRLKHVVVTSWTGENLKTPSRPFLDDLIRATTEYDFAILIFGPSDVIESRGSRQLAPRDNVVFELGLFMSQLDRERTIVVAPATWQTNLKILSDVKNSFNLIEYNPPPLPKRKTALKQVLEQVLSTACAKINERVLELGVRTVVRGRGPKSVNAVSGTLERFIRDLALPPSRYRKIQNLALDMEHTWSLLHNYILDTTVQDIHVQALMIDHNSEAIRALASDSVSLQMAAGREQQIIAHCTKYADSLRERKVTFECRAYGDIPTFHGFLFNDKTLLFSFCDIRDGKLEAGHTPYLQLDEPSARSRDHAAYYFLSAFRNWFEHRWVNSRRIWPDS